MWWWIDLEKKRKLTYSFHNPNGEKETADYILKILIESNKAKVDREIEKASLKRDWPFLLIW